ncbi:MULTISPECIES: PepSY-like domain-containing protein [Kordia]|uniref:PepSY-like domain-containing protein n=1 Tax=Kordia TaxID=221065 RepID=UPI00062998E7|nr:PepSY-like domain-containing protein [Kordia jejudonensis]
MKIKLLTNVFICLLFLSCDEKEVKQTNAPKTVQEAFLSKFPSATKIEWEKENDTEWEAEFEMNTTKYSANFGLDGSWRETEHEIEVSEISKEILSNLKAEFPNYNIDEIEISETPSVTLYEFSLKKGDAELEVSINLEGKIVGTIKED